MDELAIAKRKLDQSLGDHFKAYLKMMREWFTDKMPKEEFDYKVRQFLPPHAIAAHNQFLLALLNKCTSLAPLKKPSLDLNANIKTETSAKTIDIKVETKEKTVASKPVRKKFKTIKIVKSAKKPNLDNRFEPINDNGIYLSTKLMDDCVKLSKVSYCRRESTLPDHFMSHLRVFVVAWELGVDGVQDNAVKLCNAALRDFIKTILTAILASRSSYRIRDNRFKYNIGAPPINPYLKNSFPLLQISDHSSTVTNAETGELHPVMKPTIDDATNDAMYSMACAQSTNKRVCDNSAINLRHLLYVLKTQKNVIPSYSVYANAVYRVVCRLTHNNRIDEQQQQQ